MRVVRELAMVHAETAGRLLLHAAALDVGGRAIAVLGPKRAGKTSLLLHLLRAPGARFIANDRVFVDDVDSPRAIGLPSIVSLRPGTLELFPDLRACAADRGYAFWETLAESRRALVPLPVTRGSDVTPAQLCDLLRVRASVGASLSAFVFPQVEPGYRNQGVEADLTRLDARTTEGRLRDSIFGGTASRSRSALVRTATGQDARALASTDAICADLARTVPAFDYRLGSAVLSDRGTADQLADVLTKRA